jgi:hypothetical protein
VPRSVSTRKSFTSCDRENVIGSFADELTAYRVDSDYGALDRHHMEQCRDGDDLVRFFVHLDLPEHEARGEGRDHGHVQKGENGFHDALCLTQREMKRQP